MNKDLKFIQGVIRQEIKSWTGYRREMVDDTGEEEFIQEMSLEIQEFDNNESPMTKDIVLDYLCVFTIDYDEDCV